MKRSLPFINILPLLFVLAAASPCLQGADDTAIAEHVTEVLKDFPPTSELDVSINVTDGVATLTGSVENLPTKRMASEAVATVNGVKAIINRMKIREIEKPDREIEFAMERLLSLNRAAKEGAIDYKVNDGVVTLTGTVSTFAVSHLAHEMAESIHGVRSVTNLLRIKPLAQAEDDELRQHLALTLQSDPWIAEELVTATVDGGVITLRGAVDTVSERDRLISAAEIYGVTGIDASKLYVSPELRTASQRAHRPVFRSDKDLEASLAEAYRQDPRLLSSNIDIEIQDGMIMLSGTVNHLGAKAAAVSVANQLPGATTTLDFLLVDPDNSIPAAEVETALQEILNSDALLNGAEITAQLDNGIVTLTGEVENPTQRRRAVEVSMFTHGVERVISKLRVDWETPDEYARQ